MTKSEAQFLKHCPKCGSEKITRDSTIQSITRDVSSPILEWLSCTKMGCNYIEILEGAKLHET